MASATGVLPEPPAVRLPTQMTQAFGRYGRERACRSRTDRAYAAPNGDNSIAQVFACAEWLVQKSGARMRRQQAFGRLHGRSECSAHFLHCRLRQFTNALRLCGIDQQFGCELFQIVTRSNSSNSLRGKHDAVNVVKISGVRAGDDRYAKARGLQRILSTV